MTIVIAVVGERLVHYNPKQKGDLMVSQIQFAKRAYPARSAKHQILSTAPTPGPWQIEDDTLVYYHWKYSGYPNFGRIMVARLDNTWPQGEERQANLELIAEAVNACFIIAPQCPIAAAMTFPTLVNPVKDFLKHCHDPQIPKEIKAELEQVFNFMEGVAP